MFESLQFSIVDMTPYSRPIYFDMIGLYNKAVWPMHVLAMILMFWLLLISIRPGQHRVSSAFWILGAAWLWTGWIFHMQYYSSINWAGVAFGYLFLIQGGLLLALACIPVTPVWNVSKKWPVLAGRLLLILAIVAYPLTGLLEQRTLIQLDMFAMTPTPTLMATLAFLLLLEGRIKYALVVIPLLWAFISASFAWTIQLLEVYAILLVMFVWLMSMVTDIIKFTMSKLQSKKQ